MRVQIEITEDDLKRLILAEIERRLGDLPLFNVMSLMSLPGRAAEVFDVVKKWVGRRRVPLSSNIFSRPAARSS